MKTTMKVRLHPGQGDQEHQEQELVQHVEEQEKHEEQEEPTITEEDKVEEIEICLETEEVETTYVEDNQEEDHDEKEEEEGDEKEECDDSVEECERWVGGQTETMSSCDPHLPPPCLTPQDDSQPDTETADNTEVANAEDTDEDDSTADKDDGMTADADDTDDISGNGIHKNQSDPRPARPDTTASAAIMLRGQKASGHRP